MSEPIEEGKSRPRDEKEMLFEDLDKKVIEWGPYKCFVILYIFNATIALPIFTLKLIYLYIEQMLKSIRFLRIVQVFFI